MPSLFDIGKSGVQSYRQALAVTGQNIANINTDGYKRREAGPFASDWAIENYNFDSRAELIAAVEAATLDDVRAFFDATVFSEDRSRLVIQLRGKRFAEEAFATLDGGVVVEDVDQFHRDMAVQPK